MENPYLKKTLQDLKPRLNAILNYKMFELAFPPGVEDDDAKAAAHEFAKANGRVIRHHPAQREVNFVKA